MENDSVNRRTLLLGTGAALGAGMLLPQRPALAQAATITGAGASFPRPVYERWGQAAREPLSVTLNYQSIGSGGGVNQITNRTVDFGASDAPLPEAQLRERNLLQFPTVMGSVVVIVNLPGVADNALKLTPEVLADLFLGRITRWNDARIAELNRDLRIPNLPVSPVYRADSSGTTFVFTSYLARTSEAWKSGPGAATSVQWPVGQGQRGNEGVSNGVRNTPGAIGYTENAYATVNRLVTTQLRNKAGNFVKPTPESGAATLASVELPANLRIWPEDPTGAQDYPIATFTWVLLYKKYPDAAKLKALKDFVTYGLTDGQKVAPELGYIPLPAPVVEKCKAALATVQ